MYIYIHIHIYTYIHIYIYTYIHIYIYTYIHIYNHHRMPRARAACARAGCVHVCAVHRPSVVTRRVHTPGHTPRGRTSETPDSIRGYGSHDGQATTPPAPTATTATTATTAGRRPGHTPPGGGQPRPQASAYDHDLAAKLARRRGWEGVPVTCEAVMAPNDLARQRRREQVLQARRGRLHMLPV